MEINNESSSQWVHGNTILEVVDKYVYLDMEISKEGVSGEKWRKANEKKTRKVSGMIQNGEAR